MAKTAGHCGLWGVARRGGEDKTRAAPGRLARQYHPDVNGAPDAADRFKQITEAYEVLTDPQRRQRYDMFGTATGGFSDFGIGDLFETFFGGDLRRREPRGPMRGADLRMEIEIDLLDAVQGRERVITVPRLEICERCRGSGAEPGSAISTCGTCGGRGEGRQGPQAGVGRVVEGSASPPPGAYRPARSTARWCEFGERACRISEAPAAAISWSTLTSSCRARSAKKSGASTRSFGMSKSRRRRSVTTPIYSGASRTRWAAAVDKVRGAPPSSNSPTMRPAIRWLEIAVPAGVEAVEAVSEILDRVGYHRIAGD